MSERLKLLKKILGLKNLINEMKNKLKSTENRAYQIEKKISELKERNLDITQWKKGAN